MYSNLIEIGLHQRADFHQKVLEILTKQQQKLIKIENVSIYFTKHRKNRCTISNLPILPLIFGTSVYFFLILKDPKGNRSLHVQFLSVLFVFVVLVLLELFDSIAALIPTELKLVYIVCDV